MTRPSSEPAVEDVVRHHERQARGERESSDLEKGWGENIRDQNEWHRGAAASLRQLMEENERYRRALEDITVGGDGMLCRFVARKALSGSATKPEPSKADE